MSLTLEQVSLRNGPETIIRDVSLRLERGTINVLLGPTLAGKTSLMRLMAGLEQPSQGRVLIDGNDVTGVSVRKRSVAMVYQQFINYPNLTVYENIASPLRVARAPKAELQARVDRAVQLLRLDKLLDRLPAQLSGGQQQRTAIARALVKRADLVLLDEPLANLDYKLREELREELPESLRGVRCDSGLCDDRTDGGAAARRHHDDDVARPGHPGRAGGHGLSSPGQPRRGPRVFRPAAQ